MTWFDESEVSEPSSPSSSDNDAKYNDDDDDSSSDDEFVTKEENNNTIKFREKGVVWNISTFENVLSSVEEV